MTRPTKHRCSWCYALASAKETFKFVDGPIDWHFCNTDCAKQWLLYRHRPSINRVLKQVRHERRELLDELISELE